MDSCLSLRREGRKNKFTCGYLKKHSICIETILGNSVNSFIMEMENIDKLQGDTNIVFVRVENVTKGSVGDLEKYFYDDDKKLVSMLGIESLNNLLHPFKIELIIH